MSKLKNILVILSSVLLLVINMLFVYILSGWIAMMILELIGYNLQYLITVIVFLLGSIVAGSIAAIPIWFLSYVDKEERKKRQVRCVVMYSVIAMLPAIMIVILQIVG